MTALPYYVNLLSLAVLEDQHTMNGEIELNTLEILNSLSEKHWRDWYDLHASVEELTGRYQHEGMSYFRAYDRALQELVHRSEGANYFSADNPYRNNMSADPSYESPIPKLKPCPFCGFAFEENDVDWVDVIHRCGVWYRNGGGYMSVKSALERKLILPERSIDDLSAESGWSWVVNCATIYGGCGAEISGDSRSDAINRWNRRVTKANRN